jgi:hypothetical protein
VILSWEALASWRMLDHRPNRAPTRQSRVRQYRPPDLFAAHIWIAMISIISRRLVAQTQAPQGI